MWSKTDVLDNSAQRCLIVVVLCGTSRIAKPEPAVVARAKRHPFAAQIDRRVGVVGALVKRHHKPSVVSPCLIRRP